MTAIEPLPPRTRFGAADIAAPPLPPVEPEVEGPRRRRWWVALLVVLAVAAAVAGALFGGRAWGHSGKVGGWAVTSDLAAGTTLTSADVTHAATIHRAGSVIVASSVDPVGKVLSRSLAAGDLLLTSDVSGGDVVPAGNEQLIGVALPAGDAPATLTAGDTVAVLGLPYVSNGASSAHPPGPATVLQPAVLVVAVSDTSTSEVATIAVPDASVPNLTALSAQQRIALALVTPPK